MCEGAIEDKVDVVFNVFDFNNAGAMTKEELVRIATCTVGTPTLSVALTVT